MKFRKISNNEKKIPSKYFEWKFDPKPSLATRDNILLIIFWRAFWRTDLIKKELLVKRFIGSNFLFVQNKVCFYSNHCTCYEPLFVSTFKGPIYQRIIIKAIGYCNHSVNIIKNVRAQRDNCWRLLRHNKFIFVQYIRPLRPNRWSFLRRPEFLRIRIFEKSSDLVGLEPRSCSTRRWTEPDSCPAWQTRTSRRSLFHPIEVRFRFLELKIK